MLGIPSLSCPCLSAVPEAPALLCQGKRTKDPTGNLPGAAASAESAPAGV